jgi:NAD(P)-dependent dehydrogenase (short-subunit alcohol dehydrogenase family)
MVKSADKLIGKKIIVVGGTSGSAQPPCSHFFIALTPHSIGFGAAQAFIDAGAKVTVISSNEDRVKDAVKRLDSTNAAGKVGNVREEETFIEVLKSLAPVDHIVFSSVDKIIRGNLADLDLDNAKHLFGVKFWGAIIVGKGLFKPFTCFEGY